jgi:hypothetical protein
MQCEWALSLRVPGNESMTRKLRAVSCLLTDLNYNFLHDLWRPTVHLLLSHTVVTYCNRYRDMLSSCMQLRCDLCGVSVSRTT